MQDLQALEAQVKQRSLPRHVGIIMDGNGRWAETRGKPRLEGHREGSDSVREVTRCARRLGIEALTLYAFSSQNWSRPADEVAGLMHLLREYLESERPELMDNGVRLVATGELDRLPGHVREPLDALCADSQRNGGMILNLALSYGGREELVAAARRLARELPPEKMDEAAFEARLWTGFLPPADLIIRTSGELRLSNFLLWHAAYAELLFTETPWPEFRQRELLECLVEYQDRERRFGLTQGQIAKR